MEGMKGMRSQKEAKRKRTDRNVDGPAQGLRETERGAEGKLDDR